MSEFDAVSTCIAILATGILCANFNNIYSSLSSQSLQISSAQYWIMDDMAETALFSIANGINAAWQVRDWIIEELFETTLVLFKIVSRIIDISGKLSDIKKSIPKGKVYQLAYVTAYGGLARFPNKLSFYEVLAALGVTGAMNVTAHSVVEYNRGKSSEAQRLLEHLGQGKWGVYTHYQSAAKALAIAFGWKEAPEVHGSGMYGHYHDSTHTFHIWYGGQLN